MKRLLILFALLVTLFVLSLGQHFTPLADDSGDRLGVNWNSGIGGGSGSGSGSGRP